MVTAPDLVESVVGAEDQIIDPRGRGDYLWDYEFLVDFGFERLYSAAEDQLDLDQDVQGPDLERWTLEQFDDLPINQLRCQRRFLKGTNHVGQLCWRSSQERRQWK